MCDVPARSQSARAQGLGAGTQAVQAASRASSIAGEVPRVRQVAAALIGLAPFVLAALEHLGIVDEELARSVDELGRTVEPLSYDAARQAVAQAVAELPPWCSCAECRLLWLNTKSQIIQHHAQGHPSGG